jgi:SAM-dependent methyltransferase
MSRAGTVAGVLDEERRRRAGSFGLGADDYELGRPGYPEAALHACLPAGATRVLDLGAGTGKLTRELLRLGLDVVAVEPLADMRARIPTAATVLDGAAEAIPLADASVDAVVAGQAFHWFEREHALAEIRRVLRPGGHLGLLWNLLDDRVPWVAAVADAFGAEDRATAPDPEEPYFGPADGFTAPEPARFAHRQELDADGLVANVASRSPVIIMPPAERAELLRRVRELAPPGRFALPYVCSVRAGRRM